MTCGQAASDSPSQLCAHEVETVDAERLHQYHEVIDYAVKGPTIVAWHRSGSTKTTHVRAHYTKMTREMRYPSEPRCAALGVAMKKKDRFRLAPRIGIVVYEVVHLQVRSNSDGRHCGISQMIRSARR